MRTSYNNIALIIGISLILVSLTGIASAVTTATTVELIDGKFMENASESYTAWAYADASVAPPTPAEFNLTLNDPNPWVSGSGHLALMDAGDNMTVTSTVPTTCMYVQFEGDWNDGWAKVYVDGSDVWIGNTYNIGNKYLKITDMTPMTHTVEVECMGINGNSVPGPTTGPSPACTYNDHVCMLHFGIDKYNNQEIPEFPTVALPIAAIIGLAFFFQRRKD